MATGSGKTKVMALAIAWQYFNAAVEGREEFARTALLIAPNVIVFERLREQAEENGGVRRMLLYCSATTLRGGTSDGSHR
jgi:hypothetical protein